MKVFISFSSADKKIAEKIYDRLKKKDIDCWICTKDIPPGADYQECIVKAINCAQVVVLVFSSQANSSTEIAKELSLASKKILIPARIEDVLPQGSFEYQLSNRQFVDLFDDFDNKLEDLSERIKAVLESGIENSMPRAPVKSKSRFSVKKLIKPTLVLTVLLALVGAGWFFMVNQSAITSQSTQQATLVESEMAAQPEVSKSELLASPQMEQNAPVSDGGQISEEQHASESSNSSTPIVSEKVKGLQLMLGGTSGYDRLNGIKAIKDQLPTNLNAKEADELLMGANSQRGDAISVIASNLSTNLGGKDLSLIMGGTTSYDRLNSIKDIEKAGKIKNGLTPDEVKPILEGTLSQRRNAISVIASNLSTNLGGNELSLIMGETSSYDRLNCIKDIAKAGKIKNELKPDEVESILAGTLSQRRDAISVLASNLAANLGGNELSVILGNTESYDRLNGIKDIAKAGKIKNGLKPDEVDAILLNMGSQKIDGLKVLTPYMAK